MRFPSLVIVGNPEPVHVGAHFLEAAQALSLEVDFLDSRRAFDGSRWSKRINWWLRGRRPTRLHEFSAQVLETCCRSRPGVLLAIGMAPLDSEVLRELARLGVRRCNYLTDDPWNPAHRAPWFFESLGLYDHVFSTRRANLADLRTHGCAKVSYLPFAYSPSLHGAGEQNGEQTQTVGADLIFAGGADPDRVPYLAACIKAGFRVQIHGGYWERYPATRNHTDGIADPVVLRKAISRAKVSLCLVRRANRDGHVMRTFELPALGVCMLTEDTDEHRDFFGVDGENVVYFRTPEEAVDRLRWLITHDHERARLAASAHQLIVKGKNTYSDRLETILTSSE
jgi:spore maturation protein CgeB